MKDKFSIGSKREGAKEITLNITKKKVVIFLLILLALAYLAAVVLEDNVKEALGEEMIIGCINGTKEPVQYGEEYYCGDHYTVLQGKVQSYDELVGIIRGIENGE